jgi:hypothetical protein
MAPDRIGSDQGLFYIYQSHVATKENTVGHILYAFHTLGGLALFPCISSGRRLGLSDLFLKNRIGVSPQVTTARSGPTGDSFWICRPGTNDFRCLRKLAAIAGFLVRENPALIF